MARGAAPGLFDGGTESRPGAENGGDSCLEGDVRIVVVVVVASGVGVHGCWLSEGRNGIYIYFHLRVLTRVFLTPTTVIGVENSWCWCCRRNLPHSLNRLELTDEFGNDFSGLPVRRSFETDFNGLSVRRNLPQLSA